MVPVPVATGPEALAPLLPDLANPAFEKQLRTAEDLENRAGQPWGALAVYLRLLERVGSPEASARLSLIIGRCYARMGRMPQALGYFRSARDVLAGTAEDPPVTRWFALGQVALGQAQTGDVAGACQTYMGLYESLSKYAPGSRAVLAELLRSAAVEYLREHVEAVARTRRQPDRMAFVADSPAWESLSLFKGNVSAGRLVYPAILSEASRGGQTDLARLRMANLFRSLSGMAAFYGNLPRARLSATLPSSGQALSRRMAAAGPAFPYPLASTLFGRDGQVFGFTPDPAYLRESLLPPLLREDRPGDGLRLALTDASGNPLAQREREGASCLLISKELPSAPAGWRLGLFAAEADHFAAAARRSERIQYGIIAILACSLGFGVFLLLRDLARESVFLRMKSEFLDRASHTLKTPLTRLRLQAERLQLGWTTEPERHEAGLNRMLFEIAQMKSTIDNLLDFSRAGKGKESGRFSSHDLADVIRPVVEEYEPYLTSQGFACRLETAEDLPPVRLDPAAVRICLENLLQNAVHYSADERSIRVVVERAGPSAAVRVEDRGLGLPPEELDLVFHQFRRGSDPRVQAVPGSGLGLFITRRLMEVHGGEVRIVSRPGQGSAFSLIFPLAGDA